MKILMIAPQPFFEPRGTPFSVLGRLKALSQLGHEVDLLTYHVGQNVTIPNVVIHRIPRIPFIKQVRIGPSMLKLFLDVLLFAKAFVLLLQNRYDLIHSHEEASFFTIFLAKLHRIRHLYDMHSSLPQQLRNFQYTRSSLLIGLFEWFERRVINGSQAVITVCLALEKHVQHINDHVPHVLIENVPMEGDDDKVSDVEVARFKAAHALHGHRIVLYCGTFEPYQGLELLIASAARVLEARRNIVFLLMGGNPNQVEHYQGRVQASTLATHFRFTGQRPAAEMPLALRAADVLVSPRVGGTNTPLKIYAYLQAGKPIVATDLETHTQVLTREVAVLVDPKPEAFAEGILSVLDDPPFGHQLGKRARDLFEQQYSVQTFIQKTDYALQLAVR